MALAGGVGVCGVSELREETHQSKRPFFLSGFQSFALVAASASTRPQHFLGASFLAFVKKKTAEGLLSGARTELHEKLNEPMHPGRTCKPCTAFVAVAVQAHPLKIRAPDVGRAIPAIAYLSLPGNTEKFCSISYTVLYTF